MRLLKHLAEALQSLQSSGRQTFLSCYACDLLLKLTIGIGLASNKGLALKTSTCIPKSSLQRRVPPAGRCSFGGPYREPIQGPEAALSKFLHRISRSWMLDSSLPGLSLSWSSLVGRLTLSIYIIRLGLEAKWCKSIKGAKIEQRVDNGESKGKTCHGGAICSKVVVRSVPVPKTITLWARRRPLCRMLRLQLVIGRICASKTSSCVRLHKQWWKSCAALQCGSVWEGVSRKQFLKTWEPIIFFLRSSW